MKYTTSFKVRLMAFTTLMSLTCIAQGSQRVYQQMLKISNDISDQAENAQMSNTLYDKLTNYFNSIQNNLKQALSLSKSVQASEIEGISEFIGLVAEVAESGAIHDLKVEAKQNIANILESVIGTLSDPEQIENVNFVLNTLEGLQEPSEPAKVTPQKAYRLETAVQNGNRNRDRTRLARPQKRSYQKQANPAQPIRTTTSMPIDSRFAKLRAERLSLSTRTMALGEGGAPSGDDGAAVPSKKKTLVRSGSGAPAEGESKRGFFSGASSFFGLSSSSLPAGPKASAGGASRRLIDTGVSASDVAAALTAPSISPSEVKALNKQRREIESRLAERDARQKAEAAAATARKTALQGQVGTTSRKLDIAAVAEGGSQSTIAAGSDPVAVSAAGTSPSPTAVAVETRKSPSPPPRVALSGLVDGHDLTVSTVPKRATAVEAPASEAVSASTIEEGFVAKRRQEWEARLKSPSTGTSRIAKIDAAAEIAAAREREGAKAKTVKELAAEIDSKLSASR